MNIDLRIVLTILFIHWFADFVCQTDKEAQGKSKNWEDLLSHTVNYSLWWFIPIFAIYSTDANASDDWAFNIAKAIFFVFVTFISHTVTDFYTSRVNSKLWEDKQVHNFFVSIGFDQFLHYLQLFLTFYYINKF